MTLFRKNTPPEHGPVVPCMSPLDEIFSSFLVISGSFFKQELSTASLLVVISTLFRREV